MYKKVILIDLDGVLNKYTGKFDKDNIPTINEGAKEFLARTSVTYDLKLFTTRNKILAAKWLIKNEIDNYFVDITNTKDLCYLYVDDRCIRFNGNYEELSKEIENFEVWYK